MHVYTVVYVMLDIIKFHVGDYNTHGCVGSMIWTSQSRHTIYVLWTMLIVGPKIFVMDGQSVL